MKRHGSYFQAHDHHRLYYESHHPKQARAVLIFVHGVNEHSGRYRKTVNTFKKDFTVYLYDHRGHGRSDGMRSHVENFSHYVNDLHEFVSFVAQKEVGKIFIIGHSMGGQVVVNTVAKYPKAPIAGFITSSPNIRLKMKINPLKKFIGMKLSKYVPRLRLPNDISAKWISRDRDVVRAYENDPLVGRAITAKLAFEILKNLQTIMSLANKIKIPALMMHAGEDRICDKEGTIEFFSKLKSRDKELEIFDDMYHEIFNEIGKEKVFARMRSWLEKRV